MPRTRDAFQDRFERVKIAQEAVAVKLIATKARGHMPVMTMDWFTLAAKHDRMCSTECGLDCDLV